MALLLLLLFAQDLQEGFEGQTSKPTPDYPYPKWEKVRDDTHPFYNDVQVVEDPRGAHGGRAYLRMVTQGGATALQQTIKGALEVSPGREYTLRAFVRIVPASPEESPRSNIASVHLRWLGHRGQILRIDRSPPIARASRWVPVTFDVPSAPEGARWVQIRLSFEGADVRGECRFDDVALQSRLRVIVRPVGSALPVFAPGSPVKLRIAVPALRDVDFHLRLEVRDSTGRARAPVRTVAVSKGRPVHQEFDLPGPGAYELYAEARKDGSVVARKRTPLLVPAPLFFRAGEGGGIGLVFQPFQERYLSPGELADLLAMRSAKIILWDRASGRRPKEPTVEEILGIIRDCAVRQGTRFIGVLSRPPAALFPGVGSVPAVEFFAQDRLVWEKSLDETVRRFQEVLDTWQIGSDEDAGVASPAAVESAARRAGRAIRSAQKEAAVGVPLPVEIARTGAVRSASFYSLRAAQWNAPDDYRREVKTPVRRTLLRLPLRPRESRRAQSADLLKTVIYHATSPTRSRLFLDASTHPHTGLLDGDGYPTAPALAIRAADDLLTGAVHEPMYRVFLPPVRHFVFRKGDRWLVAAWSESGPTTVEASLGPEVRLFHPLDGIRPLKAEERIVIDDHPVFFVGLDPSLLRTLLAVGFHATGPGTPLDSVLPLRSDRTAKILRVTNHFPEDLTDVRLRIEDPVPDEWDIAPREIHSPRLRRGETFDRPLSFLLPSTAEEQDLDLSLVLRFQRGDGNLYSLRIKRRIEVRGEIRILSRVVRDGAASRVSISIRNQTGRTIALRGEVRAPGLPDRPILVGAMESSKTYDLPPFRTSNSTGAVRVRVTEVGGKRLFANKTIRLGP